MRFKLQAPAGSKAGTHYHEYPWPDGPRYAFHDGDVIEDDRDLVKLIENKFVQVPDNTPLTKPAGLPIGAPPATPMAQPLRAELSQTGTTDDEDDNKAPSADWAKQGFVDVTSEFPDAAEGALMVIKKGRDYGVIKAAEQNVLLNKDAPLKRSEVNGFIDTYLHGNDK